MSYDEDIVQSALDGLRQQRLTTVLTGERVAKYGHRASETLNLNNRELAVICVLLLRGAQTLGELKTRTERLYPFDDLESIEGVLLKLAEREMAVQLPRLAGTREPRWMHLLSGPVDLTAVETVLAAPPAVRLDANVSDRVAKLEAEVEMLKAQFAEFRKQFD